MARRPTRPELTAEQRTEADRILSGMLDAAEGDLRELAELLATKDDSNTFGATEFTVRDIVLRVGAKAVEAALAERKKGGYDGCSRSCPGCGESARFHRWQFKPVVTVLGAVRVERAYYHCRHCHAGHCPRDTALGLGGGDLSRGASEAVALAGALSSFAEAAERTLPKLCGLRVSESTVERVTEGVGADVGERLARGRTFGEPRAWEWSRDAEGKTVGYVSADLTGVGMQGANGAAADVGMVWNAGAPGQVRYVCELRNGQAGVGQPLRNQAGQVGLDRAERWVGVSDGGAGLEDLLRTSFPRVEVVILDFLHVAEHLSGWAKAVYPDDPTEAGRVTGEWCHRLKHEGGQAMLAGLRAVDVGRKAAAREAHRALVGYFENQGYRMDYPAYRAKGWVIGSGPVEAACKQVVNQRLKVTGARWSEAGADAVCHLRALFRSETGQWDAYWASLAG